MADGTKTLLKTVPGKRSGDGWRHATGEIRRMEKSWEVEFVSRDLFSLALTTRLDVGGASSTIVVEERHYIDDPTSTIRRTCAT
jgi:hypothetical protein